ncbi:hypothetical protein BJ878DRAFT_25040 [Calycina marina]|uniref:Uncharacterized protein n=1 Tax=Calycina marina TaxID=1763456 RepID=A0A9P7Z4W0_9HELO|nr:hypothetical protein BJ878DRAFT_25040 [Calycina marina]
MFTSSLLAGLILLNNAASAAGQIKVHKRLVATAACNHHDTCRSFVDYRTSLSASYFCSTYLQSIVTATATIARVYPMSREFCRVGINNIDALSANLWKLPLLP